mmetsp:Transcript_149554/g.272304  ORF Transcript_149554/g.272304 Transcript_149554/m.272304 type:complete len:901 (-) Transcript_149554:88-2790(-)
MWAPWARRSPNDRDRETQGSRPGCSDRRGGRRRSTAGGATARRLGKLSLAVALPTGCRAALSISSGYETFLMQIRRRIVCEEGDLFDEAEQRVARPCDSIKDGPFCRGLPRSGNIARHRPFTVDSIVPQHIFGDTPVGEESEATPAKQATATLNQFLEEYYNPREVSARALSVEGRLDFRTAAPPWIDRGLPLAFSRGLPEGILATWEGAWQALPGPESGGPSGGFSAILRLNGAVGTLRFSRPVVVRRLIVRPPLHLADDGSEHQLMVRARKAGKEAWRSAYDYAGSSSRQPACSIGDVVVARWSGDGRRYLAILIAAHETQATLRWLDDDHTHRLVSWSLIKTSDGRTCQGLHAPQASAQPTCSASRSSDNACAAVGLESQPAREASAHSGGMGAASGTLAGNQVNSVLGGPTLARPWRDVSRRLKAVDEITFSVPFGAEGWLLGEVSVAAISQSMDEESKAHEGSQSEEEGAGKKLDQSSYVVQVFPGPRAMIMEVSSAAVLYHSDDMLERGLRLRSSLPSPASLRQAAAQEGSGEEQETEASSSDDDRGEGSAQLRLSMSRSVEGLRQLLRALADPGNGKRPAARLPPHVRQDQLLRDAEKLTNALDASKAEVRKYGHFEAFFAMHWDWATPLDALQVTFERWRRAPETRQEAEMAFFKNQEWTGSYFCSQGPTQLQLQISKVTHEQNRAIIEAELSFQLNAKSKNQETVHGSYTVKGRVDPHGRALALDPVPGSWKSKPKNFVMVGLQGVVSKSAKTGILRYAGSVPIFGCDSFELQAKKLWDKAPSDEATPSDSAGASAQASAADQTAAKRRAVWNSALARLAESLTLSQKKWRAELQHFIADKSQSGGKGNMTTQVQQLFEAARTAGLVSFELTTQDGEQVVVQMQQQQQQQR